MPAPSAAMMKQLARFKFKSARAGGGSGALRGLQPADAEKFLDDICDAICSAWATWQTSATLVGVVINAVSASAGHIVGPPLTPLILANGPKTKPQELKLTNTVANVIGTAWLSFTATVKVPGLASGVFYGRDENIGGDADLSTIRRTLSAPR